MTERKRKSRTGWAKVDAHVITAEEYEEAPELTDEFLDTAEIAIAGNVIRPAKGTLTRPGRPKKPDAKKSVHLRFPPEVLAYFRNTGPGWQTRVVEMLSKAAKVPTKKSPKPRR